MVKGPSTCRTFADDDLTNENRHGGSHGEPAIVWPPRKRMAKRDPRKDLTLIIGSSVPPRLFERVRPLFAGC